MARRIINKAYNDLVGGAGTETISISPELPKKSSVLRLSSKDVPFTNRQAVEIKPSDGRREMSKMAPQPKDPAPAKDKPGRAQFVNIDGDGSVKIADPASEKKAPDTAYKMKSFMSSVDLSPRGRTPVPTNSNSGKPPMAKPEIPKVVNPPEDFRMFLPKGIHNSDQPYVVPKFMPPYREMMAPKPKPDPLVSIVERTPPSLQKWAVEWNSEPKKTISIDELKEDLMREAAEKPPKPPGRNPGISPVHESNPEETVEDEQPKQPHRESQASETVEEPHPNPLLNRFVPPWTDADIHPSFNNTTEVPEVKPSKIGKPLVDWKPPKYCGRNRHTNDPRNAEYSFQDAIKKGTPQVPQPHSNPESKLFFRKPPENAIYYDTEEQKFHQWFKERMSAAVNSARQNTESAPYKGVKKPHEAAQANPSRQNKIAQSERNPINNVQNLAAPEAADRPKPSNHTSTSYETESTSSFHHWLKLRGHHITKNEQSAQENKEKEKAEQNVQNPQFPWSVSYTLRRRVSTPNVLPKRPASSKNVKKSPKTASHDGMRRPSPKNLKKSHKTVSQDGLRRPSPKNRKKPQDTVSHDDMSLKRDRNDTKSENESRQNSRRSGGKKFSKTNSKRNSEKSVEKKQSSTSKTPVKNSTKKIPMPEPPRLPLSSDHLWINDNWHVDSEMDHINHLRKMETYGNSPKATTTKKNFLPTGAPQMKYWESKYTKKPGYTQRAPSADDVAKQYSWLKSKKATDLNKLKEVDESDNDGDASSSVVAVRPSFTSSLLQTVKDKSKQQESLDMDPRWAPVMDFPEDFDVARFLHKEESEEKELLETTRTKRDNKAKGGESGENDQSAKVRGKEHIKFPRMVKIRTDAEAEPGSRVRVEQKLNEDEFLMALGEDPGLEDLEWSEFIGPRNSLDNDSDLTRLMGAQARQLGSAQNVCL